MQSGPQNLVRPAQNIQIAVSVILKSLSLSIPLPLDHAKRPLDIVPQANDIQLATSLEKKVIFPFPKFVM